MRNRKWVVGPEGRIEPGRVSDRIGSLDEVPGGYRAMNEREILKFQVEL